MKLALKEKEGGGKGKVSFCFTQTSEYSFPQSISSLKKPWLSECSPIAREGSECHHDAITCAGSRLLGPHKLPWLQRSVPF